MELPQSSLSCAIRLAGHAAGTEKLFTNPVSVSANWLGVQPAAASGLNAVELVELPGRITAVMFTVLTTPDIEMLTLPE